MPYSVQLAGDIYWAAFRGRVTNDDLLDLAKTAAEIEATFTTLPHRLVDFGHTTQLDIDYDGMNAFARKRLSHRFPNEFKSALIAPGVVQYGFARMYQTLVSHSQIRVAVFPTTDEGLQWLAQPGVELPKHQWAPAAATPPSLSP